MDCVRRNGVHFISTGVIEVEVVQSDLFRLPLAEIKWCAEYSNEELNGIR